MYDRIKALCAERGITLEEVSRRAGLGKKSLNNWTEHSPSVDKVAAVARVLGVTVDELLREPEPTPEEQAKRDLAERLGCPVEALEKLDPSDLDTLLRAKPRTEAV